VWSCEKLKKRILDKVENEIQKECKAISSRKVPSVLSQVSADDILALKDIDIVTELKERAPVTHRCMQAIARSPRKTKNSEANHKVVSSLSMAASVLLRCRNPCLSAAAYRFSVVLWHGGVGKMVSLIFYSKNRR
jgi:transposase